MAALIQALDLTFSYRGGAPVLRGVNFSAQVGELVLIAGATGSGKSTFLNCLMGIAPHYTGGTLAGELCYRGQSLVGSTIRERTRHIGSLLQNVETQLFTDRVEAEVAFGLENLNVSPDLMPKTIAMLLAEFGLSKQRTWSLKQLSAGQKQRLVLACVLAMNQSVLLLDEPFAYLDQAGCALLLEVLAQRVERGQTVILVEHRVELLTSYAHRVYHFAQGQLVAGLPRLSFPPPMPVPAPCEQVVLRTRGLGYGAYPAYPDLTAYQGETLLLKGANGCGKTTLLKLLSGLLKPTVGSLELLGQEVRAQSASTRARAVGFVLQNPNHQLFAESVLEELQQPSVDLQHAEELLAGLKLTALSHQHPQALSQGQKRRLALGAVLARQPRICLLDEITVGQDPESLHWMLLTVRKFTERGGTLILTSHDPRAGAYLGARSQSLG
ncbi:ABC transporter ATP-binding protein [Anthocerotibacter panamensis]|uniref:ABC transporter ATP-binding protein n=1 Tax=Anthocerotibacter panamensis TaxID=2857077 RepID=UPI001C407E56|nr:ABC transporter ATP-binding protein [Anthocerotibacter panamensis]